MLSLVSPVLTLAASDSEIPVSGESTFADQDLYIQNIIDAIGSPCSELVQQLYILTGSRLIWSDAGGLTEQGISAVTQLGQAAGHGLDPRAYLINELEQRLSALRINTTDNSKPGLEQWTEFDVALSRAMLHFVSDIYRGRINPLETGFNLVVSPKQMNLADAVYSLSESQNFTQAIRQFEPRLRAYQRLKQELARYSKLVSRITLPKLASGKTVHSGDNYGEKEKLQFILTALGDYIGPDAGDDGIYSAKLAEALQRFQVRHGLEADGVIGAKTFAQLNTPLDRRIEQIKFSMERLRWLSTPKNGQHIVVNIPAFELYGFEVENGVESLIIKMKVIVGSAIDKHDTPVFAEDMEYLVFRPYWNVPHSITVNELLPRLTRETDFLNQNQYEILQDYQVIDSSDMNAELLAKLQDGTYRIRQRPGEKNALGLIKFIFPNSNSVYLHDTPAHRLFSQSRRDFSHGCIRVENPPGLAEFVLQRQNIQWRKDEIIQATKSQDDQKIDLENYIPVHIFYTTTVVRDNGDIAFFDDLYGHDKTLRHLLARHNDNHCHL